MRNYLLLILIIIVVSCSKTEEPSLPSADERISQAKSDLFDKLTKPANGWVLNYQPIPGTGNYYILLNFNENGTVNVQSDVQSDNKDFYNDDIPFRIDTKLSLELILETYTVFHYLFEQQASTFEAEFEFLFVEEDGEQLIFASKTDVTTEQTILTFVPAESNAGDLFSREIQENWLTYKDISPRFLGASPAQQLVLSNDNISLFWNINFLERKLEVTIAAEGSTIDEVHALNNMVEINHSTTYSISNDKFIFQEPFSFSLNGSSYSISEIELSNFDQSGDPMCQASGIGSPVYTGNVAGIGSCLINKTLYDHEGSFFQPLIDNPYTVNVLFVIDSSGYSLSNSGSIGEHFPTATAFAFNYGYIPSADNPQEPSYAVGLYMEDDQGIIQHYLREFEMTTTVGNKVIINLLDSYYFSSAPGLKDQQNLESITDEIFTEGLVYASGVEVDDITVFRLYNPCNSYEVYLVK